ncbi:MAG: pantoate--beta-alanine ligase [Muribaculaceae bacterium]|nr:pantoate--beta-alanine ligase [Muribaculaceae bacterium]
MIIIKKVSELETYVGRELNNGKSIGLVPTMGALHAGHLSLVERAVKENDDVIVSVFVNPTQFNNPEDLSSYPRTEEEDCRLLAKAGVTVAFVPAVEEMYPDGAKQEKEFKLGTAAEVMEGKFRPGHFQGVAQIVSRLFEICRPTRAYFGEKDFQQIAVIKNMVESEGTDVEIVPCPIKRADDGLALSSRNALLTPEQRSIAPAIHKALSAGVEYSRDHSVRETHDRIVADINAHPGLETEYLEIVDARTLLPVEEWSESPEIVGCVTVYCGKVRLIDNIKFK